MALSTLTHVLGPWETVTTPGDGASTVDAITAAINDAAMTKLTVKNSGSGYVEFGHTSGSLTAMSYVITVGSVDGSQMAGALHSTSNGGANAVYIGMAPEGGTFNATNRQNATGPYGVGPGSTSTLWSGYMISLWNAQSADQVRILANDEYFFLDINDGTAHFGNLFGAWLEAPTASAGHKGTSERVYAASVPGIGAISTSFWVNGSNWLGNEGGANTQRVGVFRPGSPSSASFVQMARREYFAAHAANTGVNTTHNGTRVHLPFSYKLSAAPQNLLGWARQMRVGEPTTLVWQEGDSGESIIFSPSTGSAAAALAFDQSR